jgi:hypothetical protein
MRQQSSAYQAAEATAAALQKGLGNQLQAVYLFGSLVEGNYQPGQSNVNLLAVVADDTRLQDVRTIFQPVWAEFETILQRTPLIATTETLARYFNLRPAFGHHLAQHGQRLVGRGQQELPAVAASETELLAPVAAQVMTASVALAPQLVGPEAAENALILLRRLARRLTGQAVDKATTAASLFALVQTALSPRLEALALTQWQAGGAIESPPLLPQLLAIYEETDQVIMVLPEMTTWEWLAIDWNEVAERLVEQYYGLQVVTPGQLRLVMTEERASDLRLGRVRHVWGAQPLAGITVETGRILRAAGRLPAELHLDGLPYAYLSSDEEQDGKIIHDFQNRLLNVQLQHELLHRLAQMPRSGPPTTLPGRDTPSAERIKAIMGHLDWWAGYYAGEMKREA